MGKELLIMAFVMSAVGVGCMSSRYAYHERRQHEAADSLAMTKEDVIVLSKEGVGDAVIIDQIKATNAYFELSKDDIIELKKAGVSEKVIRAMIQTSEQDRQRRIVRRYYWSPYLYAYPLYSGFWWGFSYRYYRPYIVYRFPLIRVSLGFSYRYYRPYYYYIAPRVHPFSRSPAGGGYRSSGRSRR